MYADVFGVDDATHSISTSVGDAGTAVTIVGGSILPASCPLAGGGVGLGVCVGPGGTADVVGVMNVLVREVTT
jgi:hypothetical protein